MEYRHWESQFLGMRWFSISKKVLIFAESNASHIFHGNILMFWDKHLIILAERIFDSKEFLIKFHSALSYFKHLFVISILERSFSSIHTHLRHALWGRLVHTFVRPCNNSKHICRYEWRFVKHNRFATIFNDCTLEYFLGQFQARKVILVLVSRILIG